MIYRYTELTATDGANVSADRGIGLPENASKKKGLVALTSPEIHKAPYTYEGNLYRDFNRI